MQKKKMLMFVVVLIGVLLISGCSNDSSNDEPGVIAFKDDFSTETSGWSTRTSDEIDYSYNNGKYEISVSVNGKVSHLYWPYAPIDRLGSEYTIEADMTWVKGESGYYGFIFNYVNDEDYCIFKVNPITKYYIIRRKQNTDTWSEIIDWTKDSDNINDVNNHLKLIQKGDKLEIYINEVKVDDASIVKHSEGIRVGFLVSTTEIKDDLPITAQFDNFEVHGYASK